MTDRVNLAVLEAHIAKGWDDNTLLPKGTMRLIVEELKCARAQADSQAPVACVFPQLDEGQAISTLQAAEQSGWNKAIRAMMRLNAAPQPTIAPSVAQVKAVALRVSYGGRISDDPILINDASPMSEKYWKDQGCIVEQLGVIAPSVAHRGGDAWISIEDRLPEIIEIYPGSGTGNSEPVLVCLEGEDDSGSVIAIWRYFRGGQGDTSSLYWDWASPKVTHWMPLPAAPESTEDVAAGEKS